MARASSKKRHSVKKTSSTTSARLPKRSKPARKGRTYDVISVGSASIDCFMRLPHGFSDIKQGSKVLIEDMEFLSGGGGSNVAVGLSRLGLKTGFIGEVGCDISADAIRSELDREGVDFVVKHHDRHKTAYSVVLETKGQDRAILVHKGASSFLHDSEIPKSRLSCSWFYFASVIGDSLKTMYHLAKLAAKKNVPVYLNPSGYMIENGGKFFRTILSATTILALNKEEAQSLLKTHSSDPVVLLKGLRKKGPEICIITDGKRGAYAFDGKTFFESEANHIPVIDTTGAGDAFGAGFLAGWILKEDMEFALDLAIRNSESVIGKVGAKTGLLYKNKEGRKKALKR